MTNIELAWLAGLLEGEGWFRMGGNSIGTPGVSIQMTDEDIVRKASRLMKSLSITRRNMGKNNKTAFSTSVYGDNAIELMKNIMPFMGKRRTERILQVLAEASRRPGKPGAVKLRKEHIPLIRHLYEKGMTQKAIGKMCGTTHGTISSVVRGVTWP